PATTAIFARSLHDALPIYASPQAEEPSTPSIVTFVALTTAVAMAPGVTPNSWTASVEMRETTRNGPHCISTWLMTVSEMTLVTRSEEHTSELQSRENLVCR